MDERAYELIRGAGDVHVHTSPSLVPNRKSNIWGLIEACEARQMAFAVVKWHHGDSFSAARVVNDLHHGPFRIYGGIVLNRPVGGLNPAAVDTAITLGAKIVWLPTLDSQGHGEAIGQLGGFPFQQVRRSRWPAEGLSVTGEDGELKAEVKDIVELVSGTETVLASGHITVGEIVALQRFIRRERRQVNLLVNHVDFSVPALTASDIEELAAPNVWFELAYFTISALGHSSIEAMTALIEARPDAQFVLATDSGQEKNPIAPDAMLAFISLLLDNGLRAERVERMLRRDTRALLKLGE